jgi:hypothetical protein
MDCCFEEALQSMDPNVLVFHSFIFANKDPYLILDGLTTRSMNDWTTTYQAADIAMECPDGIPGPVSQVDRYWKISGKSVVEL